MTTEQRKNRSQIKKLIKPLLNEKKCKKCKRTFIAAPQHIYKVGKAYYCSWTCYNHRNDKEVKNENN